MRGGGRGGSLTSVGLAIPFCLCKINPRIKIILNRDKNRGPNFSLALLSPSLSTSLRPSMHSFLLQSRPTCAETPISSPSYSMTLGPLPFQAKDCKTRTPHRTPHTAEASRLRPGQRVAAGESERLARGKRWEEKTLGAETGLGATCGTSAGATPVLAMAARHLGAPGALAAVLGTPTLPRPQSRPL